MDLVAVVGLDILNGVASLFLLSLGLAIIFGMMRVINLAHGEFIMLGAYATVIAANNGVNIWVSMLVIAPLFVAVIGIIVERLLIRHLYGRMVDTMLATWGLSLLLVGIITTIFGNTIKGVPAPLGGFEIGAYRASYYSLFLVVVALTLALVVYLTLRLTKFGLIARGTMQNPEMAAALGISPPKVYRATFAAGAALSGLAGGVLAPVSGVLPTMGVAYIAKTFITVIGGGASILTGTAVASGLFGGINQGATFMTTPVLGEVALLVSAIVLLRILPQGLTGQFFRRSL